MEKIEILKKDLVSNENRLKQLFSIVDSINYMYGREENDSKVQKTEFFNKIEVLKDSVFVECGFTEKESQKKHIIYSRLMPMKEEYLNDEEFEFGFKSQALEMTYYKIIEVLILGFKDENGNTKMINEFIK